MIGNVPLLANLTMFLSNEDISVLSINSTIYFYCCIFITQEESILIVEELIPYILDRTSSDFDIGADSYRLNFQNPFLPVS